jgi:hypothetical protein
MIGFTGTRQGMTDEQKLMVMDMLTQLEPAQVFHGDCTGADADFDYICKGLGIIREIYPGTDSYGLSPTRAYCDAEIQHPSLPYLVRDKIIAEKGVDGLMACPKSVHEERRSGTWATVRYARKLGRRVWILYPGGSFKIERG